MVPRWLFVLALTALGCTSVPDESPHDAGTGGRGGSAGFDPFGDAWNAGGGCDGEAEAATPSDAATDATDPACESAQGASSYQKDVAPILIGCTGEVCHTSPTRSTLVGQPSRECCDGRSLVVPFEPSASYLLDKLEGKDMCGGVRMPSGKPPLANADIDVIVRWICAGALDD